MYVTQVLDTKIYVQCNFDFFRFRVCFAFVVMIVLYIQKQQTVCLRSFIRCHFIGVILNVYFHIYWTRQQIDDFMQKQKQRERERDGKNNNVASYGSNANKRLCNVLTICIELKLFLMIKYKVLWTVTRNIYKQFIFCLCFLGTNPIATCTMAAQCVYVICFAVVPFILLYFN